jgi:ribose 5-phosphate isomerase B
MRIALASDHAGYAEKERLKPLLLDLGVEFEDLGTTSEESVDYPDYARKVAEQVAQGEVEQGLLVCGSGTGMAITANKVPGVRAAACYSVEVARNSREHNGANVLTLGSKTISNDQMREIVRAWLTTELTEERHRKRVGKIDAIERQYQR